MALTRSKRETIVASSVSAWFRETEPSGEHGAGVPGQSDRVQTGGLFVREVRDPLREDRVLRDRVDDHERRLSAVERSTG
jgi:hypothetical protein